MNSKRMLGFSLIELLLVLAILGIIGAIAVPKFMGQRTRARVIGDAIANARTLQMGLEARKADSGTYGTPGTTYGWKADGSDATGPALIPTFQPSGNSKMNFSVKVEGGGLTYELTVTDPSIGTNVTAYKTNQAGVELARLPY